MKITSIAFSFVPFHWLRPRLDRCVIDTTVFFGPLRIYWINQV